MSVFLELSCLNRITIRYFLFFVFILLIHPNAIAEESPGYRVQLLIFQNAGDRPQREEAPYQALLTEALLNLDRNREGIEVSSSSGGLAGKLAAIYKKLNTSADYDVLFAGHWKLRQKKGTSKPAWVDLTTADGYRFLTGRFRLTAGHLLFANVDIVFHDPNVVSSSVRTLTPFLLNETRRIRLDEVHYFDHPKLGVILTVHRHPVTE